MLLSKKKKNKPRTKHTALSMSSIISPRNLHSIHTKFHSIQTSIYICCWCHHTVDIFPVFPSVKEFEYLPHINHQQKSHAKLCQKFGICAANTHFLSSCSRPSAVLFHGTATRASSVAQHRQNCCVGAEDSTSPTIHI